MASGTKEIAKDLSPAIKVYKDGTVERPMDTPNLPPTPYDPTTGVSSKDITVTTAEHPPVSARLFLPKLTRSHKKFPVLVYFHGGGFCVSSPFSLIYTRYVSTLSCRANALFVSVDYRLAPEHPLPAAFDDSWAVLQWVASHSAGRSDAENRDPWLLDHVDFERVFVGGDSAGGNIAHHMLLRAGKEGLLGGLKIEGGLLLYPYFWGSELRGREANEEYSFMSRLLTELWKLAHPKAERGCDNWEINPLVEGAPSLSGLGCGKMMVCVAEKDVLRDRNVLYVEAIRGSGWNGEVDLVEILGEDHCFDIFNPDSDNAHSLANRFSSFIS